ncbi:MAG: OsmC family peroxiredoxin [Candidatus Omnitrophica bacterium]|nr:OsmC family peroxiredoxin [Candidatus Omnitrophota bacterium]MBD3269407.1 OsmC family peroxiredoxin [Candidatus Omnitrophota bacterium]
MPGFKSKIFIYTNSLEWGGKKKGKLTSPGKPDIEVSAPPEFSGHPGVWSPEDLFVASVNSCIMTTFLFFAQRQEIVLFSYESRAEGILERVEKGYIFSRINIEPVIYIGGENQTGEIKEIIKRSEENCLISNSIKSKVEVSPLIKQRKD